MQEHEWQEFGAGEYLKTAGEVIIVTVTAYSTQTNELYEFLVCKKNSERIFSLT